MKFRQLLPLLFGVLLMGAPVAGASGTGTPVSLNPPSSAAAAESVSEEKEPPAPPWEDVVVTDDLEKNNKTDYYAVKPLAEKQIGNGRLTAYFSGALPEGVKEALRYTQYPIAKDYLIQLSGGALSVRSEPRFGAQTLRTVGRYQHIATDGIVEGEFSAKANSRDWYRVRWQAGDELKEGYVFTAGVTRRGFQFNKMVQAITQLRSISESGTMAHVDNYKNRSGWAPSLRGQNVDDYGVFRDQSAPVYFQPDTQGDFRYLTDGSLVKVLSEHAEFFEIDPVDFEGVYYIPKKYLHREQALKTLSKVVVVDRNNQNEAVFEYAGGWQLISYLLATTGENAPFKQETSLGNFMVIEKKSKFLYLGDITKEIEGYAPFALRFNGGAYVHGVPVNYQDIKKRVVVTPAALDLLGNIIAPAVTKDVVVGRKDPGIQEYLSTIGTVPRSHKCVRNYTSHAKFLYDWAEIGNTAVIVIE